MTAEVSQSVSKPPLREVVLGVQFEPLPKFSNAYLGAFWKRLGSEWLNPNDAAPLPAQIERFGEDDVWSVFGLGLILSPILPLRIQIRKHDGSRMIQAQNGRFHYNWMSQGEESNYPRYEVIRREFDAALRDFLSFLADEKLGEFRPNQWELSYINQILKGGIWTNPTDCGKIFRHPEMLPSQLGEVTLGSFAVAWQGEIRPKRGRLHIDVQHGRLVSPESPETITVTLTARGAASSEPELNDGLERGHVTILDAFRNLTSDAAQAYWGLNDENS